MTRVAKKIHFPTTRLTELAARSGGVSRDQALEEAKNNVQESLDLGIETIENSIKAIEAIVYKAKSGRLPQSDLVVILREADHVVTMAGTFGFGTLEEVVKCLCDVTDGLLSHGLADAAPIIVHVQAMRLAAPGGVVTLGEKEAARILAELAKVRSHYQFASLAADVPADVGPPGLAE